MDNGDITILENVSIKALDITVFDAGESLMQPVPQLPGPGATLVRTQPDPHLTGVSNRGVKPGRQ